MELFKALYILFLIFPLRVGRIIEEEREKKGEEADQGHLTLGKKRKKNKTLVLSKFHNESSKK